MAAFVRGPVAEKTITVNELVPLSVLARYLGKNYNTVRYWVSRGVKSASGEKIVRLETQQDTAGRVTSVALYRKFLKELNDKTAS